MIRQQTPVGHVDLWLAGASAGTGRLSRWRRVLSELLVAWDYARTMNLDAWQFAVEIAELRAAGLSDSDCRWLVCGGYIEHARELTRVEDDARRFRLVPNLCFSARSCFVLTGLGVVFARASVVSPDSLLDDHSAGAEAMGFAARAEQPVPNWSRERHELHLGDFLVKRFKWIAANQETILTAFEEEGWPPRIDDPLPPQPEQDPKRRLHDTIKCLNRNQLHRLIHFRGDGTGEGILWEQIGVFRADGAARRSGENLLPQTRDLCPPADGPAGVADLVFPGTARSL